MPPLPYHNPITGYKKRRKVKQILLWRVNMGLEKRRSNRAAKEQAKKKCEKKIYKIIGKIVGIAEMIHALSVLIWGVGLRCE